jgi:hypothetical protein
MRLLDRLVADMVEGTAGYDARELIRRVGGKVLPFGTGPGG